MSDAFEQMVDRVGRLLDGVESGLVAAVKNSPLWIRQEFTSQARRKLDTSFETYMNALFVGFEDNVLIAELDETDWLANAVEKGASAFDMRKGLLSSRRARVSKAGWRYASIPIRKMPNAGRPGTERGQEIHDRLLAALQDPVFVLASSRSHGGAVVNMERLVTNDPQMQGLYRVRRFKSVADAAKNRDFMSSQYILFRTVSENPATLVRRGRQTWQHPGIQPANIFDAVQTWVDSNLPDLVNATVKQHIEAAMRR